MLSILSLFFIIETVASMREEPNLQSPVVSQAIFSEQIFVEKEEGGWSYVQTPDGYKGWVPSNSYVKSNSYETADKVSRLAAHVYGIKDTELGPVLTLPFGAKLKVLDKTDARWALISLPDGRECYIQKGDILPLKDLHSKEELAAFSEKFLDLPYTWDGRSSFGYDCSGFIQMLYSQIGIDLERDARQQINDWRLKTIPFQDLEIGDLIFFGKSPEKITHVAMSIGNGKFIQSTVRENQPWVRISALTDYE